MGTGRTVARKPQVIPQVVDVGFIPDRLDPTIAQGIALLENIGTFTSSLLTALQKLWERLEGELSTLQTDADGHLTPQSRKRAKNDLDQFVKVMERLARATVYFTTNLDVVARLRAFGAGGPDSRTEHLHDLSDVGEVELMAMAMRLAAESPELCEDCRAKLLRRYGDANGR